jgi:hypothetical protein
VDGPTSRASVIGSPERAAPPASSLPQTQACSGFPPDAMSPEAASPWWCGSDTGFHRAGTTQTRRDRRRKHGERAARSRAALRVAVQRESVLVAGVGAFGQAQLGFPASQSERVVELGYHRPARCTCTPDQEVLYWICCGSSAMATPATWRVSLRFVVMADKVRSSTTSAANVRARRVDSLVQPVPCGVRDSGVQRRNAGLGCARSPGWRGLSAFCLSGSCRGEA